MRYVKDYMPLFRVHFTTTENEQLSSAYETAQEAAIHVATLQQESYVRYVDSISLGSYIVLNSGWPNFNSELNRLAEGGEVTQLRHFPLSQLSWPQIRSAYGTDRTHSRE